MSYNESLNPNSNYPPMSQSQWDNSPFNQVDTPEKEFEVTCSQSLSRTATVTTNNYVHYEDEGCDDGVCYHEEWDEFPDTDWSDEYHGNGHYTPIQIIQRCEELCRYLLERDITSYGKNSLERLLEECQDWQDDETEYVLD